MAKSADYNLGEYTFPRGWFVMANSATIGKTPVPFRYFGEDVVLYRGDSGAVVMLEAYCPHMGTHLGQSRASHIVTSGHQVEGDSIRCPFHGWRFGPDGVCNNIPYFDGAIPAQARLRSWPVKERYGIVFCWNDPEGLAPDFDLPDYPEWDDPAWVRWGALDHLGDLPCHPIEIFDNTSDYAHLNYLHGGEVTHYENEVEAHLYHQRQSMTGHQKPTESPQNASRVTTIATYTGPGLDTGRFVEIPAAQLIAATPIDDGSTRLWQCAMMKAPPGVPADKAAEVLRRLNQSFSWGIGVEDGEVWTHKRAATRVMQLPTDGPFLKARAWYSQFFNPRAKTAQIVGRVQGMHFVRGIPGFAQRAAE